jgi:hypothetical protein
MSTGEKQITLPTFEAVLDSACEGLQEKKVRYSLRRISEMEESLLCLERELDAFLREKGGPR